jgi:hypothetical protein
VYGCGWCSTSSGSACLSDPDECAGAAQFSWTWEPTGCTVGADAGVTVKDGEAPDASAPDASVPDVTPPRGDVSVPDSSPPAEDVSVPDATPASDATPE